MGRRLWQRGRAPVPAGAGGEVDQGDHRRVGGEEGKAVRAGDEGEREELDPSHGWANSITDCKAGEKSVEDAPASGVEDGGTVPVVHRVSAQGLGNAVSGAIYKRK